MATLPDVDCRNGATAAALPVGGLSSWTWNKAQKDGKAVWSSGRIMKAGRRPDGHDRRRVRGVLQDDVG